MIWGITWGDLYLCFFAAICGYFTSRSLDALKQIKKHRRALDALFAHARAWPFQADHYFTWIIIVDETGDFLMSKVAYETQEQAGLMGYTIWRDYGRTYESREWKIYVQKVSIDAKGDVYGNVGLNDIALDRAGSGGEPLPREVASHGGAVSGGGGPMVGERAGMVDPVEPAGPG